MDQTTNTKTMRYNREETFYKVNVDDILEIVSEELDVGVNLIVSKHRTRRVVEARMLVAYFLNKYTNMTLEQMTNVFSLKHHSAIMYYLTSIENLIESNDAIRRYHNDIDRKIKLINGLSEIGCSSNFSGVTGEEFVELVMNAVLDKQIWIAKENLLLLWDVRFKKYS